MISSGSVQLLAFVSLMRGVYSVGELGTNANTLEKNLREILELSSIWKAVVLLDEADIFLEQRTESDIKRNAMVGIFLRLLEYHDGVMFLTTNRVKCFDEAFHSRISISLKYEPLNAQTRAQVWRNFLSICNIGNCDIAKLANFDLNGRQIRTTVRLAQCQAKSEGVEVTEEHLLTTIQLGTNFKDMIASSK